jgi:hypothetical protein
MNYAIIKNYLKEARIVIPETKLVNIGGQEITITDFKSQVYKDFKSYSSLDLRNLESGKEICVTCKYNNSKIDITHKL